MQGRFIVAVIRCPLLSGEEGQNGSDVRASQDGDPVNLYADALVGGIEFGEVGVVRVSIGDGVDGSA